ncbi:MAG: extradiol dioxygenase [Planctomycetes bacterium]|nr:extradiol dioxygenase [Planctomycetota bacterium]
MITGAHSIIYSKKPEEDREFFRDVLGMPNVDAGDGWLIFGLPPAEVAVHPAAKNGLHEFFLICANVESFARAMAKHGVRCSPRRREPWGILTQITLPGGGKLGVYEPKHPRPKPMKAATKR